MLQSMINHRFPTGQMMEAAMNSNSFQNILKKLGFALVLAVSLFAGGDAVRAAEATAEQRAACTPDVFRLCASHIPSVSAITACMRKEKPNLSAGCKAVFDK